MKKSFALLFIALFALSCHKDQSSVQTGLSAVKFNNVLILGNNSTFAANNSSSGWSGNWGMAATVADSDYVHHLTALLKQNNSSCVVKTVNIAGFETGFATFNVDSALMNYKNNFPDLLIVRIGENVPNGFNAAIFDTKYAALINYFKAANPNMRVFAAGSFFSGKAAVDNEMKKYSAFISLSYLDADSSNSAYGLFTNPVIAANPSDKGMRAISNAMWQQIALLK